MTAVRLIAKLPISIDCPERMVPPVQYVLDGEYEANYDGSGLDILDVGANVGAFALWAVRRWPESRVRAFEPHPGTFAYLARNIAGHASISATNAALFPGSERRARFFTRFDGDGESGLAVYAGDTFTPTAEGGFIDVEVVDPASVPSAEIVKIDIEGGEAEVLASLDLSRTVLVLAEFQNGRSRAAIRSLLERDFDLVLDEACPWDPILDYMDYQRSLKGDVYGRIFALRRGQRRLAYAAPVVQQL
jgi:FkbM family methyltransferase